MTEEEYLRARGWAEFEGEVHGRWMRPGGRGRSTALLPFAEALEVQLAEDRARLAFVLDRSALTIVRGIEHYEVHIAPKETR